MTLTTPRAVLRRGSAADAPALFGNYTGSAERSLYLARGVHRSAEDTDRFLSMWCDALWRDDSQRFAWVVADAATDEPIGTFVVMRSRRIAEIHFGLSRERSGSGIATELVEAVLRWLWNDQELQRIWTACDVENVAARRVLEKAGFHYEGVLRRWLVIPAFGATARDCASYSFVRP